MPKKSCQMSLVEHEGEVLPAFKNNEDLADFFRQFGLEISDHDQERFHVYLKKYVKGEEGYSADHHPGYDLADFFKLIAEKNQADCPFTFTQANDDETQNYSAFLTDEQQQLMQSAFAIQQTNATTKATSSSSIDKNNVFFSSQPQAQSTPDIHFEEFYAEVIEEYFNNNKYGLKKEEIITKYDLDEIANAIIARYIDKEIKIELETVRTWVGQKEKQPVNPNRSP